jgi:hypothetical protein
MASPEILHLLQDSSFPAARGMASPEILHPLQDSS